MCWLTAYTLETWDAAAHAAGREAAPVMLIEDILNAMDVPPVEPAQVFDYARQEWVTPGAAEPPKPEPCAIVPAVEEYGTISARLREIEAEKQAALERGE